ncbi:unnamed protein product [Didymodactylos carnosus]|uniref:Uncharacterized protein n=1 Tax=Didymodactylos carnosus TaxID=1234261 RepID=A0A815ACU2_9BILA|nr:unnamed protein product [Didymodactylos carnosus]CAF1254946.1 unnamed protein product [Didymodactylos carnosus]CAF3629380.1 unnamed protein product [Didymodactylos carnosus]CAF4026707.1 unnamed protein product [Didymodactylos carnosus]
MGKQHQQDQPANLSTISRMILEGAKTTTKVELNSILKTYLVGIKVSDIQANRSGTFTLQRIQRHRGCATHALIENVLSLIFACVLVAINAKFIQNPRNKCYFTESICSNTNWITAIYDYAECGVVDRHGQCGNTRLNIIKGQLAAAVLMLAICLVYIILYIVTVIFVSRSKQPVITTMNSASPPRPTIIQQQPPPIYYQQTQASYPKLMNERF